MSELDSRRDYKNEVQDTAKMVIDTFEEYDYEDISEAVWETLNSHQWMMYNGYHLDIIKYSDTDLQYTEWKAFVDWEDYGSLDIFRAMAWALFEADVWEKIQEIRG